MLRACLAMIQSAEEDKEISVAPGNESRKENSVRAIEELKEKWR
jgi:hypothetical protein